MASIAASSCPTVRGYPSGHEEVGKRRKGTDSKYWKVVETKNGRKRWIRCVVQKEASLKSEGRRQYRNLSLNKRHPQKGVKKKKKRLDAPKLQKSEDQLEGGDVRSKTGEAEETGETGKTEEAGETGEQKIYVYGASWCGFCRKAKHILQTSFPPELRRFVPIPDRQTAPSHSVVPAHTRLLQKIKTIPAVFVGNSYLGGCDTFQAFVTNLNHK